MGISKVEEDTDPGELFSLLVLSYMPSYFVYFSC